MKLVIAGASGFVGKHLIQTLKDTPHEVVALSRRQKNLNAPQSNIQ